MTDEIDGAQSGDLSKLILISLQLLSNIYSDLLHFMRPPYFLESGVTHSYQFFQIMMQPKKSSWNGLSDIKSYKTIRSVNIIHISPLYLTL